VKASALQTKQNDKASTKSHRGQSYVSNKHANNIRQLIVERPNKNNSTAESSYSVQFEPEKSNQDSQETSVSVPVIQRICDDCEDEIQAKSDANALPMGAPNDVYEQEADRIADSVVNYEPVSSNKFSEESIQRQCDDCEEEIQAKAEPTFFKEKADQTDEINKQSAQNSAELSQVAEPSLQAMCNQCEEEIQLKTDEEQQDELQLKSTSVPIHSQQQKPNIWQRIKNLFSRGTPMPTTEKAFFETRMGHDFSQVRLHTDDEAGATAKEIGARAYAYKNHVVFAPGEYQPQNQSGTHLIAHELAHVVQQNGATPLNTEEVAKPSKKLPVSERQTNSEFSDGEIQNNQLALKSSPHQIQGDWDFPDPLEVAGDVWDSGTELAGDVVDVAGDVVGNIADAAWSIVERVAPAGLMTILNEVREKGFLGFIKEKVSDAASSLFGGLGEQTGVLGTVIDTFSRLSSVAGEIIVGLAQNDCDPLFNALGTLRDMVTELANDAFTAVADFFRPVGEFFSDLWNRFGAPVLDWLSEVAGDTWSYIQDLGQQIWDWTRPVIDAVRVVISDSWNWIKEKIGISSSEGNSSGGLIQWVKDKAGEAWDVIQEELQPVIQPVQEVIEKVQEILPLEAILNFRETVNGWLQQAVSMAQSMDQQEGGNAAENQASLRDEILPAILQKVEEFRGSLIATGLWVSGLIGGAVDQGQSFLTALAANPIVRGMRMAFDWLSTGLTNLGNWARQTVQSLFTMLGDGLVRLSQFVRPVLDALSRLVEVIGNLLGFLPDFLMGPLWWMLPSCLKDVIKTFIIEKILSQIPLFQQLMAIGDLWTRLQNTAIRILQQIFLDGNFAGALWTFFSTMLDLIGIPPQLIVRIIANAAQAFSDILMDPLGFFNNVLRAMWEGVTSFFGNILEHLFGGVTDWLFGQLDEAGVSPPDLTSFQSIVGFVFELLGLSVERIWIKLAEHLDPDTVERIRNALELAAGPFEFIYIAITEGVSGIWRYIQEQLDGLWSMILGAVVQWVNTAIIATGSRWLLSLLDATGITPVINSLIAVYRSIESFIQYINEMLEIVASVTESLAEIAAGNIARAAQFIEETIASSVPIIIGFLANQFGLGRLGERVRELVEGLRARVDEALDWVITNAIRLGQGFIDMLRSGVQAVRNWWDARKEFTDADGGSHDLYFQGERGDLIVESTPTPVGQYLQALSISDDDPQKSQKESHKRQAQDIYADITTLKRTIQTRQNAGEDIATQQGELTQKLDQIAVHLTPLMVSSDGGGRIPNPLTLAALDQEPVVTPRTSEEETVDLEAAHQMILLAKEQVNGSAELAEYFDRIKLRFALQEVVFSEDGNSYKIKLRATQQQNIEVAEPITSGTEGINMSSSVTYTSGTAAGDTVAVGMVADPIGEDKTDGSTPQSGALSGVMNKLVTDTSQPNPSKYIRGHLLNHNIGGPGTSENMYPITGAANSQHRTSIEETVKGWVDSHYWVYYSVSVNNISENIEFPNEKHPENWINSTFDCRAYVNYTDGGQQHEQVVSLVNSTYVQGDGSATSGGPTYRLEDPALISVLDSLTSQQRTSENIQQWVNGFGTTRAQALINAYNRPLDADVSELPQSEKSAITYINNNASSITSSINAGKNTDVEEV